MLRSNFGQDKDPHVYKSSCGSNDPNDNCTLLPLPECPRMRCWEHRGSVPQPLGKKDRPGKPLSKETAGLGLSSVTYSSCVLLFCPSGAVQDLSCTKPGFSCCYTLLASICVTKDLILALCGSICIHGRQGRFAMNMLISIIRARISLA